MHAVPWGTITWSSMGKQNIQAKKVYSQTPAILQSDWFWKRGLFFTIFPANPGGIVELFIRHFCSLCSPVFYVCCLNS